ncbi:uncharacterized protein FIBRA_02105 [Fibroporia radiculosa]|uniref:Uncharacterized protein n=1 Tax=Fibroporia radiculosa TaxID=599839 RepID=J4G1C8_9APHY|nr:uncharacterized protein FIBRA_02105 [Fibroporia radiculosa]CCM00078.1 predicted protein [Fibroporia radiculosa]
MVKETIRKKDTKTRPKNDSRLNSDLDAAAQRPQSDVDRIDHIHKSLKSLGAPDISREDLTRLYKGQFADALGFLADHVRGRAEVDAARSAIHQARQSETRRRLVYDSTNQSLFLRAKAADSRLRDARNEFDLAQGALTERLDSFSTSQAEADDLQATLDERRLSSLLLQVLEKKEAIRSARISQLSDHMEELRRKSSEAQPIASSGDVDHTTLPRLSERKLRVENTVDTIAALRAYHVKLSSAAREVYPQQTESRLRQAIAAALDLPEDDDRVISAYEGCRRLARSRAEDNLQYGSPLPSEPSQVPSDSDLNNIHSRVAEKETAMQRLFDHTVALMLSCEQLLQSLSIFSDVTAPALRGSLLEEAAKCDGYVDILRREIVHREGLDLKSAPFRMRDKGKSPTQTLTDAQNTIERTHERQAFLRSAVLLDPAAISSRANADVAQLIEKQNEASARVTKLLSRKLQKAQAVDVLKCDIDRITVETEIVGALVGLSGRAG